jgi:hypothetical protein
VHFGKPPERCRAIVADFHKQKHCAAPCFTWALAHIGPPEIPAGFGNDLAILTSRYRTAHGVHYRRATTLKLPQSYHINPRGCGLRAGPAERDGWSVQMAERKWQLVGPFVAGSARVRRRSRRQPLRAILLQICCRCSSGRLAMQFPIVDRGDLTAPSWFGNVCSRDCRSSCALGIQATHSAHASPALRGIAR